MLKVANPAFISYNYKLFSSVLTKTSNIHRAVDNFVNSSRRFATLAPVINNWLEARRNNLSINKSIDYPYTGGLISPGVGINSLDGVPTGAKVVEHGKLETIEGADATTDGQESHTIINVTESIEDLFEQMNAVMSGKASYGIFSGKISARRFESQKYHSHSSIVIGSISVVNATEFFMDGKLEAHAVDLAKKKPDDFIEAFGDYYVQGLLRGGYYFATVSVSSSSIESQRAIAGKISANFQGYGGGSGSFSKEMNSFKQFSDISIEFFQSGGVGADHSNLGSDFDALREKINKFATTVKQHPRTISFTASPYTSLDNFPRSSTNAFDRKLQFERLAEYEKQKSTLCILRNNLDFVRSHPELYEHIPTDEQFLQWEQKLTDLQNKIETQMRTCIEDSQKCPVLSIPISEIKIPKRIDDALTTEESTKLGTRWTEKEGIWSGEWVRIGKSRLFEATWTSGRKSATALLEVRISGNVVTIRRASPTQFEEDGRSTTLNGECSYIGTLDASGKVSGTYKCPTIDRTKWEAQIS